MADPPKKIDSVPPSDHDEVTAVWDEEAAAQHGFELGKKTTGPATAPDVRGEDRSSVLVSKELTGRHPAIAPPPEEPKGLSWPAAIALAIGVGVLVFVLVRFLR